MIDSFFEKKFTFFDRFSPKKLFFYIYILDLSLSLIFLFSLVLLDDSSVNENKKFRIDFSNLPLSFFLAVVLFPIIETYFLQHLIIKWFHPKLGKFSIVISAFIFGILHFRLYIFFVFWGIMLAIYYYYLSVYKKVNGFWPIFLLHALYNFTIVSLMSVVYYFMI